MSYPSTWKVSERPKGYRTPSPPPWSPLPYSDSAGLDYGHPATRLETGVEVHYPKIDTTGAIQANAVSSTHHHRSHASMDAFATIALSTQPMEPLPKNRKRASDGGQHISRVKRARIDHTLQTKAGSTPATSYQQSSELRMEGAELLLFFAQQTRQISPMKQGLRPPSTQALTRETSLRGDKSMNLGVGRGKLSYGQTSSDVSENSIPLPADQESHEMDASFSTPLPAKSMPSSKSFNPDTGVGSLQDIEPPTTLTSVENIDTLKAQRSARVISGEVTLQDLQQRSNPPGSRSESRSGEDSIDKAVQETDEKQWRAGTNATSGPQQRTSPTGNQASDNDRSIRDLPITTPPNADSNEPFSSSVHIHNTTYSTPLEPEPTTDPRGDKEATGLHAESQRTKSASLPTMPTSLPTLNSSNEPATTKSQECGGASSAVCASCKFAKNSLGMESDINATSWINCDGCKAWFHFACAGFRNEREVRSIDKFRCKKCKPVHGATSYVRKSTRAHSAIDYAGLHQGVVKTSDEKVEHHYIQPIKDGEISFLPENFPRMRPELVTAEFFERGNGMKEPIVIPVDLNPPQASRAADSDFPRSTTEIDQNQPTSVLFSHLISEQQRVQDDGQDGLGMVMPRELTVQKVSDLYGPEEKIEVIDVKSQNGEGKKWNMRRWAEYYGSSSQNRIIRNVISLEVSQSRLGRLIRRPQIVRDLDLQDAVWPQDLLAKGDYPHVQFYCLMSVADCFTDFHIDFGGSSVFYHILKGKKTFFFIPPKEKHLKKYEEWCMSPAQNWTFLPDQTRECYRVDLSEGDTMLIPSGWIHAVWTPEDSLVIGGNFLTRLNYGMQFRVSQLEKNTGVGRKFRYPHFQKIQWFTVFKYLEDDPVPVQVEEHLVSGMKFARDKPTSDQFDTWGENAKPGPENFHARYYSQAELEGLPDLLRYVLRTVLIENGTIMDGISSETRNAVRKSIPRGHGEPMSVVKTFAIWVAWKRGNEIIPYWAYPEAVIEIPASDKHTAGAAKRLAEEAAFKAPRRHSERMQSQREPQTTPPHNASVDLATCDDSTTGSNVASKSYDGPIKASGASLTSNLQRGGATGAISHRKTACDSCRRRRRACKHKDTTTPSNVDGPIETAQPVVVHTEAFLNGNALQEKLSSISGLFTSLAARSDGSQVHPTSLTSTSENPIASTATEDLVADASQVLPPPNISLAAQQNQDGEIFVASENGSPSRPRAKACGHCRKSKRRCIHDAFGNEDPVKIAESAVPRPHARKTLKLEPSTPKQMTPPTGSIHGAAPVASMMSSDRLASIHEPLNASEHKAMRQSEYTKSFWSYPETASEQVDPTSEHGLQHHPVSDLAQSTHEDSNVDQRKPQQNVKQVGGPQQPSSSLVSPPASSHSQETGSVSPVVEQTPRKVRQASTEYSQHSRGEFQSYTPESGTLTRGSHDALRDADQQHEVQKHKKSKSFSDWGADEESLRLIKELQVQDLGLRRRANA